MAEFKKINVQGTGNPVLIQDLQFLWDALNGMGLPFTNTPRIVGGFAIGSDGISIGEGVISFNGQLWYLPAGVASVGQYLFAFQNNVDQRVYEDGVSRAFYTQYEVKVGIDPTDTTLGTLIGQATASNLGAWASSVVGANTVGLNELMQKPFIVEASVNYDPGAPGGWGGMFGNVVFGTGDFSLSLATGTAPDTWISISLPPSANAIITSVESGDGSRSALWSPNRITVDVLNRNRMYAFWTTLPNVPYTYTFRISGYQV